MMVPRRFLRRLTWVVVIFLLSVLCLCFVIKPRSATQLRLGKENGREIHRQHAAALTVMADRHLRHDYPTERHSSPDETGVAVLTPSSLPLAPRDEQQQTRSTLPATVELREAERTQVRLLVFAYMRTGSTLLGDILQKSPDVFYWFEPLHKLGAYYPRKEYIQRHNLTGPMNMNQLWLDAIPITQAQAEEFRRSDVAAGNLSAILSCDIGRVWLGALIDAFSMKFGKRTEPFRLCFVRSVDESHWNNCVDAMTQICRYQYKVTVVKTIRFHMARALEMMRNDPKLKVVHLVRDPRPVLLSRFRHGYANFNELPLEASRLCRSMSDDLELAHSVLDSDLQRRYKLIRYEDIAASPLEMTKSLYSFAGLVPTETELDSVKNMTMSAKVTHRRCRTCKPRKPLTAQEVAQAWRLSLTDDKVRQISGPCSDVMAALGYRVTFKKGELRNLSIPVLLKPRLNF